MTGSNLPTSVIRSLSKMFALFVLGFVVAVPCVRAQYDNGCCASSPYNQYLTCSQGNCLGHANEYACREYAGPGESGVKVLSGGVLCCNMLYPTLFTSGYCEGTTTQTQAAERQPRLEYVRTCSGDYGLALENVSVDVAKAAVRTGLSHETSAASK